MEDSKTKTRSIGSVILGAAFLMATSAVGPGFLTQTTVFTNQLKASFGFVILISVVLDIFAQLNIWRVLTVTGKRAQDIANETIGGSGYVLAVLVALGGLIFNVGNIAGCGLGINVLFGIPVELGAAISAVLAIGIFLVKEAGKAMDMFVKILGVVMLVLIVYVVFAAHPPLGEALQRTLIPAEINFGMIVTLVGGTVGGYITFAGAHRLIDAGISGPGAIHEVNRSAVTGIMLTATIRVLLFLAALGVVSLGATIDPANPPASVFLNAAGQLGYKLFGIVMWAAAITSVVGAAFTSVSFFKNFNPALERRGNSIIVVFIVFSTLVFLTVGNPVSVLLWAGKLNGFILPIGLALVLLASRHTKVMKGYVHSTLLQIAGWLVVVIMAAFSILSVIETIRER